MKVTHDCDMVLQGSLATLHHFSAAEISQERNHSDRVICGHVTFSMEDQKHVDICNLAQLRENNTRP